MQQRSGLHFLRRTKEVLSFCCKDVENPSSTLPETASVAVMFGPWRGLDPLSKILSCQYMMKCVRKPDE